MTPARDHTFATCERDGLFSPGRPLSIGISGAIPARQSGCILGLRGGGKRATGVHRNFKLEATMFTIARFPGSIRDI
jgi:hypothetical protein